MISNKSSPFSTGRSKVTALAVILLALTAITTMKTSLSSQSGIEAAPIAVDPQPAESGTPQETYGDLPHTRRPVPFPFVDRYADRGQENDDVAPVLWSDPSLPVAEGATAGEENDEIAHAEFYNPPHLVMKRSVDGEENKEFVPVSWRHHFLPVMKRAATASPIKSTKVTKTAPDASKAKAKAKPLPTPATKPPQGGNGVNVDGYWMWLLKNGGANTDGYWMWLLNNGGGKQNLDNVHGSADA